MVNRFISMVCEGFEGGGTKRRGRRGGGEEGGAKGGGEEGNKKRILVSTHVMNVRNQLICIHLPYFITRNYEYTNSTL